MQHVLPLLLFVFYGMIILQLTIALSVKDYFRWVLIAVGVAAFFIVTGTLADYVHAFYRYFSGLFGFFGACVVVWVLLGVVGLNRVDRRQQF